MFVLQSDAYSVCLICHNDLNQGSGGTRELQCTHTFHKEVTQQEEGSEGTNTNAVSIKFSKSDERKELFGSSLTPSPAIHQTSGVVYPWLVPVHGSLVGKVGQGQWAQWVGGGPKLYSLKFMFIF